MDGASSVKMREQLLTSSAKITDLKMASNDADASAPGATVLDQVAALPDSTTTAATSANPGLSNSFLSGKDVTVTVDTAIDSFPELFPDHDTDATDDILGDVISCCMDDDDKMEEEEDKFDKKKEDDAKEDILAAAISAVEKEAEEEEIAKKGKKRKKKASTSSGDSSNSSSSNLVSSTITGFPEVPEIKSEEIDMESSAPTSPPNPPPPSPVKHQAPSPPVQQIVQVVQQPQVPQQVPQQQMQPPPVIILNAGAPISGGAVQLVQPQPQQQQVASDAFCTLALADGSVVQLRMQPQQQQQQIFTLAPQQVQQQQQQDLGSVCLEGVDSPLVLPPNPSDPVTVADFQRATSSSPPSVAEEVVLPFSNPTTPSCNLSPVPPPSSSSSLLEDDDEAAAAVAAISPMDLEDSDDHFSNPRPGPSTAFRSHSLSSSCSVASSDEDPSSMDPLLSLFTSSAMDTLTIEALKSQLTRLPEGQSADLGALLRAARIDLTVEDIVGPPLTQVKRLMEAKGLQEWQVQLCIKIRRRKKNTVSVVWVIAGFFSPLYFCVQHKLGEWPGRDLK